mmetsp:Transcript_34363/g.47951  ORF Transcript_34363/g.47951 Transcript_34363/m.47951 type:complete len:117 (+) Transcript_34363:568-918(+)
MALTILQLEAIDDKHGDSFQIHGCSSVSTVAQNPYVRDDGPAWPLTKMQARTQIIQPAPDAAGYSLEKLVRHVLPRVRRAGLFVEGAVSCVMLTNGFEVRKEEEADDFLRSASRHI